MLNWLNRNTPFHLADINETTLEIDGSRDDIGMSHLLKIQPDLSIINPFREGVKPHS